MSNTTFVEDSKIDHYTVPTTGTYEITVDGAAGGSNGDPAGFPGAATGGLGAEVTVDVTLTAGTVLDILVGAEGSNGAGSIAGGGGGGSFVVEENGANPIVLAVAGGGGGAGDASGGSSGEIGSTSSAGGSQGAAQGGGGGGGYSGSGSSAGQGGAGGTSYTAGGTGGLSFPGFKGPGIGGFGGGGGSGFGGGGGGGYDGGSGGSGFTDSGGGGGGSFVDPSASSATEMSTVHSGNGLVTIQEVCFCAGTLIRTARGDVAVEALQIGDLAATASGEHRPVRWLGHRSLDGRASGDAASRPIRITAGAFGANKPARDLYVSPAHAICIDVLGEVLIPASLLINGSTITQVCVDEVTYWHVELDSHDILIAENQPAESYLEMGNRSFFQESGIVALDAAPDARLRTHADFCRPVHLAGPLLQAVRSQLRLRAEAQGWMLDRTPPADIYLLVDGRRIDPAISGCSIRFHLPAATHDVWIVSPTSRPCDVEDSDDARHLGVRIRAITIEDGFAPLSIDLQSSLLRRGFYPVEDGNQRWTAERARLPAALWQDCKHDFFLRLDLTCVSLPRWKRQITHALASQSVDAVSQRA